MPHPFRTGLLCVALLAAPSARADEAADIAKKQEAAVEAAIKKLALTKPGRADGKNVRVVTTLPADKAKLMADAADKYFAAAVSMLKFDDSEKPWPGKLTAYVFADRSEFTNFLRSVESRRPDAEDRDSLSIRGEEPHLAMFLAKDSKQPPAEEVGQEVAEALMRAKAGSTAVVPTWLREGFSRAVRWKLNPSLAATEKARVRVLMPDGRKGFVGGGGFKAVKASDLWGDERDAKDREKLAASVIDFMASGPDAAKFGPALSSLRPSEDNEKPNFNAVMKGYGKEKAEEFEMAWKAWVIRGK